MFKLSNIRISIGECELFHLKGDIELNNGAYALVGRNGSGKSTLFNTIVGLHNDYTGNIIVNGNDISALGKDFSKEIAIVKTHPEVYGDHSVEDVLWLGRIPYQNLLGIRKIDDKKLIDQILHKLGLIHFRKGSYGNLSDGEKQLVMIGRALVQDTPILLLDEPLAFLDLVNQKEVLAILKEIAQEKVLILSTHHI
ncbi:MAG: ABC transporter ATP-binding protein, partial [Crocinitomicaceae bacterium]|nr:ABC transporter ATP-binding protein [Crocinitomicaceae bacterium]